MAPNTQKPKVDVAQLEELILATFDKVGDLEDELAALDQERAIAEAKLDLEYGNN